MTAAQEKLVLEALTAQHDAIDRLFATLILLDRTFFPSKSGQPWEAMLLGNQAIQIMMEKGDVEQGDTGRNPANPGTGSQDDERGAAVPGADDHGHAGVRLPDGAAE